MKAKRFDVEGRFWEKVSIPADVITGCWLWTASKYHFGHGQFGNKKAHRVSYEWVNGPIPKGLCILHRCDVPACVNPAHLWLGTKTDNNRDMHRKSRAANINGENNPFSKLTDEQVREIRRAEGTQRAIARLYGISQSLVFDIKSRRRWSHV